MVIWKEKAYIFNQIKETAATRGTVGQLPYSLKDQQENSLESNRFSAATHGEEGPKGL